MRILLDPGMLAAGGPGLAAAAALGGGADPSQGGQQAPPPAPITIPLSYLAQPDNDEQMQTPAKGDTGTMTVDYTVVDIQGDTAIVQPNAVNGNDLGAEGQEEQPDPDEQEGQDLQAMAGQMDAQ